MGYLIRQMNIEDYDVVLKLWQSSKSIVLSTIDSKECVARLLEKNTGLSYVAIMEDQIVGAVLCSQDGRLGYLSNLIVAPSCRRQGIARQLVSRRTVSRLTTCVIRRWNESCQDACSPG